MAGKSVGSVDDLVDDLIGQKGMGRAGFYHAEQKKQMQQHIRENIAPVLQRYYSHSSHLAEEITEQACWYMWEEGYKPDSGSHLQADPFRFLQRLMDFYDTHSSDICSFERLDAIAIVRKVRPALEAWMSRPGATPRNDPWPELTLLVEKLSAVAGVIPRNPDVLCFLADNVIHLKEKAVPHRSPFTWEAADKFFNVYHKWIGLLRIDQGGVGTGLTKEAAILYDLPIPRLENELTAGKRTVSQFDSRNRSWSTRTTEGIGILAKLVKLSTQYCQKMKELPFSSPEIIDGTRKFRSGTIYNLKNDLEGLERFFRILIQGQCQTVEEAVKCASLDVPQYNVVSVVKGGLGNVFIVQHKRQGEKVTYAVKIFGHRESMADSPARAQELLSAFKFNEAQLTQWEADINAQLREGHKHVVRYIEEITVEYCGEKLPAIKMEYVPGINLKEQIENEGPLSPSQTIRYLEQIIRGLDFLHTQDLKCMGDLKPDNILIADSNKRDKGDKKIMLADFGLAWTKENDALIPGSRFYTAPEAFADPQIVSPISDWWGVGMLAYYALTGETLLHENEGQDIPQQLQEMYRKEKLPEEYQQKIGEKITEAFFQKFILAALQPSMTERKAKVTSDLELIRTLSPWLCELKKTTQKKIMALRNRSLDHLVRESDSNMVEVPLVAFQKEKTEEYKPCPITVRDVLNYQEPVLIFGHGGQGKTMLATEIAQQLLKPRGEDRPCLPLLVECTDLNTNLVTRKPTTPAEMQELILNCGYVPEKGEKRNPDWNNLFDFVYLLDDYHKINPDYHELVNLTIQQLAAAGSKILLFSRLERTDLHPPENKGHATVQIDSRSFSTSLDQFIQRRVPEEKQAEFKQYLAKYDESINGNFITLYVLTMMFSQPEKIIRWSEPDSALVKAVQSRERLTMTQLYEIQTDFAIGNEIEREHNNYSLERVRSEVSTHKRRLAELAFHLVNDTKYPGR